MTVFSRLFRLFHTVRYLRARQIYGRLWFRLFKPRPDLSPAPPARAVTGDWVECARRDASLVSGHRFAFLNQEIDLDVVGWQAPQLSYLQRYNLHYFDDLNAADRSARSEWQRELIARWIAENPPADGVGWEPYPTSLRVVNWIKWALGGNRLNPEMEQSLAVQARQLSRRLEHHLQGNHLFSNAKALIFAGCYFDSESAQRWLSVGLAIVERELSEQILADGGHFERSTMYHALALEDLLDLINLSAAYPGRIAPAVRERWVSLAASMRRWLRAMCHPDSEISYFNDAVTGVAPTPAELDAYADRLAIAQPPALSPVVQLGESGYLRLQLGEAVLIIDAAPIGPDYLPGHAHADTLSFELSIGEERLLVNSGIDRYGADPERVRQRGTAAHNSVMVDDRDSSEVWSGFRVARRARPHGLVVREEGDAYVVECAHDGYQRLPGRVTHIRRWRLSRDGLEIVDRIEGRFQNAVAHYHFDPAVSAVGNGDLRMSGGRTVACAVSSGGPVWSKGTHYPQFGRSLPATKLAVAVDPQSNSATVRLRW